MRPGTTLVLALLLGLILVAAALQLFVMRLARRGDPSSLGAMRRDRDDLEAMRAPASDRRLERAVCSSPSPLQRSPTRSDARRRAGRG